MTHQPAPTPTPATGDVTQADLIERLRCTPYNATDPEGQLFIEAADAIATQAVETARLREGLKAIQYEARAATSSDGKERDAYAFGRIDKMATRALCAQPAQHARPTAAIEQLRDHQQQLDQDGCFVGVSRQAIDEVLQYIGEQP